ncbi:hypothetical protein RCL_jg7826.t1 [Rhizophagus clarus]|uniref:Uncharacterized protein n=1 Tax=Rhizophagus clarus TaxID=94130 RepID=A0A8H3MKK3_9GLOM|nr:hypothetical protein RCL_jg7826.t1 [Rhizophagus clarus]
MYSPLRPVDLLDQKQFPDLHLILDGKLKELAELGKGTKQGGIEDPNNGSGDKLRIPDEDVYIYQGKCTTSMIINEQNNDNQNIDITPDTISTPGFRSALQVAKGTILFNRTIF